MEAFKTIWIELNVSSSSFKLVGHFVLRMLSDTAGSSSSQGQSPVLLFSICKTSCTKINFSDRFWESEIRIYATRRDACVTNLLGDGWTADTLADGRVATLVAARAPVKWQYFRTGRKQEPHNMELSQTITGGTDDWISTLPISIRVFLFSANQKSAVLMLFSYVWHPCA